MSRFAKLLDEGYKPGWGFLSTVFVEVDDFFVAPRIFTKSGGDIYLSEATYLKALEGVEADSCELCLNSFAQTFSMLGERFRNAKPRFETLYVGYGPKGRPKTVVAGDEFRQSVLSAWNEIFNESGSIEIDDYGEPDYEGERLIRDRLLFLLQSHGVRRWNAAAELAPTSVSFAGVDFSNLLLNGWASTVLDFRGANFRNSGLERAELHAVFSDADFSGAQLKNAEMYKSDFQNAIFDGADLRDANLYYCDLRGAKLKNAIVNPDTRLVASWCNDDTELPPVLLKDYRIVPKRTKRYPDRNVLILR
jgi:hypothetical protein